VAVRWIPTRVDVVWLSFNPRAGREVLQKLGTLLSAVPD